MSLAITLLSIATLQAQADYSAQPPDYQGFRIFVSQMSFGKIKPGSTEIKATLINTGREVFRLQPELSDKLVFKFGPSFQKILAQVDSLDFVQAVFNSAITLSPGQIEKDRSLKVIPTPQGILVPDQEIIAETITETEDEKKKASQIKKKEEIEPVATIVNPEKVFEEEKTTSDISKANPLDALNDDSEMDQLSKDIADHEEQLTNEEEVGCSDLILENLTIIKQNKNNVQLAYSLRNIGEGPVNIKGDKSSEGLALRGHLSSSVHLSRGALTIGGKFVNADAAEANIAPGSSYQGVVKLPLHKLTKFTPYLILQVDPYQMIMECDETNNLQFINLLPDSPMSNSHQ